MVKNIIFHLGGPKTGSTAIQETLAGKNWICNEVTLLYPTTKDTHINHLALAKSINKNPKKIKNNKKFKHITSQIKKSNADTAVISAEYFERSNPENLKAAIDHYLPQYKNNIKYISYVRPHAARLVSAFAERVKLGGHLEDLESFHLRFKESGNFLYADRFQKWRDTFQDQYELRPMIRSNLFKNCVVHDFLNIALNGVDFKLKSDPVSNPSLSLEDLSMIREYHLLNKGTKNYMILRKSFGRHFARILASIPRKQHTKPALHKSLIRDVIATYHKDAERLDREFFDGTPMSDDLIAADAKAIDVAQRLEAEAHYDDDELRAVRAWASFVSTISKENPNLVNNIFKENHIASISGGAVC